MSYLRDFNDVSFDATGRLRTGSMTTIFDGKMLNDFETTKFEVIGDASPVLTDNEYVMSVTNAKKIIASKQYCSYFSGKSHLIELTMKNFHQQTDNIKRVGYFSSNNASPYNSNKDGFWLQSDSDGISMVHSRYGTETKILQADWNGDDSVKNMNWEYFNAIMFDFLWLGGVKLRFFIAKDGKFILAHQVEFAGENANKITKSPNHKVRYEIESTGATGTLNYVCSQVASEGSLHNPSKNLSINNAGSTITCTTAGTKYLLLATKLKSGYRDNFSKASHFSAVVNSTQVDNAVVSLELNPTFSSAPTYSNVSNCYLQKAIGNGSITVSASEITIASGFVSNSATLVDVVNGNNLSIYKSLLNDTSDVIAICATPITNSVDLVCDLNINEY